MKKRNYEKLIFNVLRFLPILFFLCWYLFQLLSNKTTGNDMALSDVLENFESVFGNYFNMNFNESGQYLLNNIFGVEYFLAGALSQYFIWLVLVELLNILYDVIIFLPRIIRNILDRSMLQ